MRYNLLVLKCAEIDIEIAFRFYLEISLELALRFEVSMDKAMGKLKRTPNNYFNLDDGRHRKIQVDGFPYMFIYEIPTSCRTPSPNYHWGFYVTIKNQQPIGCALKMNT